MDKKATGKLIREARLKKNYSQTELGDILGVTNKSVSRWETGDSFPDVGILENLARVLDLKVQDIVTGEENTNQDDAVVEVVRTIKIQLREKKRELYIRFIPVISLFICLIAGYSAFGRKSVIETLAPYVALMCVSVVLEMCYLCTNVAKETNEWKLSKYINIITSVSAIWGAIVVWSFYFLVYKDYLLFGMNGSQVGFFVDLNLIIVFVINLILVTICVVNNQKSNISIPLGCLLSIDAIYESVIFADMLHVYSDLAGAYDALILRTIIITLANIATIVIYRLLISNENNGMEKEN